MQRRRATAAFEGMKPPMMKFSYQICKTPQLLQGSTSSQQLPKPKPACKQAVCADTPVTSPVGPTEPYGTFKCRHFQKRYCRGIV